MWHLPLQNTPYRHCGIHSAHICSYLCWSSTFIFWLRREGRWICNAVQHRSSSWHIFCGYVLHLSAMAQSCEACLHQCLCCHFFNHNLLYRTLPLWSVVGDGNRWACLRCWCVWGDACVLFLHHNPLIYARSSGCIFLQMVWDKQRNLGVPKACDPFSHNIRNWWPHILNIRANFRYH